VTDPPASEQTGRGQARRAAVTRTVDCYLIFGLASTDTGALLSVPPVSRLPLGTAERDAGAALRSALASPPTTVRNPTRPREWKAVADRFLRAAGYRSWRQLETGAVSCDIELLDSTITLTPLANGGTRGPRKGFQPFGAEPVVVAEADDDEALGRALICAIGAAL
jgi:hypothetical protein